MLYAELYDYLEGFSNKTEQEVVEYVFSLDNNEIEVFVERLFYLLKQDGYDRTSYFNMYSNSTLAGAPYPCANISCRIRNLDSLARYAALYADKVLLPSPIDNFYDDLSNNIQINREELCITIIMLMHLKPLVLAGIIGFVSSYLCLCKDCLEKVVQKEVNVEKKLEEIEAFINQECAESVKCYLATDENGQAYYSITGAEKYGYHEATDILMFKKPKLVSKLLAESNGEPVEITNEQFQNLGLVDFLLRPAINDVLQAQVNTIMTESSYITDRTFDIQVMKHINQDNTKMSQVITNDLFHRVPVIQNIDINDIVTLRKKDGESFDVYRDNINSILKKYDTLDSKAMLEIQRDIINPELHKIKHTITNSKKSILKSTVNNVLLLSAGVGIGVFKGLLPMDYASVMGVIGGIPTITNLTSSIINGGSETAKSNQFYFLYELGKRAEVL